MASLQDAIAAWIEGHKDEMGRIQLRLCGVSGSSLLLQANSKRIHMSVPSSAKEAFLVTTADLNPDPSLDAAFLLLNEKFERLRPEPGALSVAMEYLLAALKKLQENSEFRPSAKDMPSTTSDAAFMDLCIKGFVYGMAMEAKQQCDEARSQFQQSCPSLSAVSTNTNTVLAWCIVKPNPIALSIDIKMQIGGIMHDDVAAAALGLPLDCPMHISLEINKDVWCRALLTSALKIVACHVKAVLDRNKDSLSEAVSGKPNKLANEGWYKDKRQEYGKELFLPELVRCFFNYMERGEECVARSSDVLKELQEFTSMSNPIVGLIHFLAVRLRTLPNWCIACWDTLPYKVGRLRTCDKDLCLYMFEDLGLGPTILQEVHKSPELMDFEISLAIAAASSHRDVFEPFPTFLLEKEEIRDRSGWFSKKAKPDASQQTAFHGQASYYHTNNKSLFVLKSILDAYPSLEEMHHFNYEVELKKALAKLWLKSLVTCNNQGYDKWRAKPWLPYDVLRFLIVSNRLTICCLKGSEELLQVKDAIYQFAVLHDNPEKEAAFERRRIECGGSFFAFHGSPVGNWFSILRNGLRSLSNSHYMSTGACNGAGIYTASCMCTSWNYASPGIGWNHGHLHQRSFRVLAICEIVNGSLHSRDGSHGIMVVRPECEQEITIRYILVLPGDGGANHVTTIHKQTQLSSSGECQTDLREHHSYLRAMYYSKQQREWKKLREARWWSLSSMCKMEEEEERRLQSFPHAVIP